MSTATTTRDRWGVPHVTGSSLLEVVREQGRVTAIDRGRQLELERRRGEGTLAELLGPAELEWDVLARRALLPDIARRAHASLGVEAASMVEAYVDGVNDGLAAGRRGGRAATVTRPWQPWTPLAVFAVQHLLFGPFPSKLWRRHLAGFLDDAELALLRTEGLPGGSNAFAVAGALTASGLPVVAGDPHRLIESPGIYAQVRLTCTDPGDPFDVTGFSFVGVPGVQHFAHAGTVAWGITNAVADDEDVYDEQLTREGDAVVARGTSGSEPVGRRLEQVECADGTTHEVEVLVTERGPVVLGGPDEAAVSLRTPAHVLGELGFDALPRLLRARTAAHVVAAFADHWVGPVNNLVVADTTGRVEHRVVGRVPERDDDGHWTGWVTDLPARTGEVLVTANDRVVEAWGRIGDDFAPPHRARRIRELVEALVGTGPVTPEQLGAVLADVRQAAGAALLDAIAALRDLSPAATRLQQRLTTWDREMRADSVEASLFAAVRERVVDGLHGAPRLAGADTSPHGGLFGPWFDLRSRLRLCLPAILAADKPFGVDPATAVAEALEQVAGQPDPPAWGEQHQLAWTGTPLPGDDDCVLANRALGGTGVTVHGPVARYVWDLAGDSRWVVPLGASGDEASPHHHDQLAAWAAGGTLPVHTEELR